jgi:hypothetical protein
VPECVLDISESPAIKTSPYRTCARFFAQDID